MDCSLNLTWQSTWIVFEVWDFRQNSECGFAESFDCAFDGVFRDHKHLKHKQLLPQYNAPLIQLYGAGHRMKWWRCNRIFHCFRGHTSIATSGHLCRQPTGRPAGCRHSPKIMAAHPCAPCKQHHLRIDSVYYMIIPSRITHICVRGNVQPELSLLASLHGLGESALIPRKSAICF